MNFILKTTNGDKIRLTEAEYKNILNSDTDVITLKSGITIRKNCIAIVYPENTPDVIEDRKKQLRGVLHDGTRVKRYFGEWVDADTSSFDDELNKPVPVRLDPQYYPEVAIDRVATQEEYETIKSTGQDYYKSLGDDTNDRIKRLNNPSGFEHISEALK